MSTFDPVVPRSNKMCSQDETSPFLGGELESEGRDVEQLRAEVESLRARHQEMMRLLNCTNPEKLVHDLRNVLNEVQLLRMLTKMNA